MRSSVLNPKQRGVRGKDRRKRVDRRTTPTELGCVKLKKTHIFDTIKHIKRSERVSFFKQHKNEFAI